MLPLGYRIACKISGFGQNTVWSALGLSPNDSPLTVDFRVVKSLFRSDYLKVFPESKECSWALPDELWCSVPRELRHLDRTLLVGAEQTDALTNVLVGYEEWYQTSCAIQVDDEYQVCVGYDVCDSDGTSALSSYEIADEIVNFSFDNFRGVNKYGLFSSIDGAIAYMNWLNESRLCGVTFGIFSLIGRSREFSGSL